MKIFNSQILDEAKRGVRDSVTPLPVLSDHQHCAPRGLATDGTGTRHQSLGTALQKGLAHSKVESVKVINCFDIAPGLSKEVGSDLHQAVLCLRLPCGERRSTVSCMPSADLSCSVVTSINPSSVSV
jgi:hypothetical protein